MLPIGSRDSEYEHMSGLRKFGVCDTNRKADSAFLKDD